MSFTPGQQTALAIVPKVSSLLSLFGSGWIFTEVLWGEIPKGTSGITTSNQKKRHHPYHRLLLAMSVYDILESCWNFGSSWPMMPSDTESNPATIWQPTGTTRTCTAQGFFLQLSVAVPIYNAFLSLYYLLVINYRMTDAKIKKWVEPSMHAFAFCWAFGTALISAVMGFMKNATLWCWIGGDYFLYQWVFYFAPLWTSIIASTVFTLMVYHYVRKIEQKIQRYRHHKSDMSNLSAGSVGTFSRFSGPSEDIMNGDSQSTPPFNNKPLSSLPGGGPDEQKQSESSTDFPQSTPSNTKYAHGSESLKVTGSEGMKTLNAAEQSAISGRKQRVSFLGASMKLNDTSSFLWNSSPKKQEEDEEIEPFDDGATVPDRPTEELQHSCSDSSVGKQRRRFMRRRRNRRQAAEALKKQRRTVEVFHQAVCYVGAFYITHIWSTSNRIVQRVNGGDSVFGLTLIHAFFDPCQGFLNYLVYQRPRYLKVRKDCPEIGRWGALKEILRFSFLPEQVPTRNSSSDLKSSQLRSWRGSSVQEESRDSGRISTLVNEEDTRVFTIEEADDRNISYASTSEGDGNPDGISDMSERASQGEETTAEGVATFATQAESPTMDTTSACTDGGREVFNERDVNLRPSHVENEVTEESKA